MSLPTPRLDDRTFEDIRREALQRIPQLCPEWTDFNPSDPGMTVVELMAWMTDVMLYRLNRLPEKNFIRFLELMGVELRPATPARTWVKFFVQNTRGEDGSTPVPIEAGTTLSTPSGTEAPLSFRTVRPLNPTTANIVQAWSRAGEFAENLTNDLLASGLTYGGPSAEMLGSVPLFKPLEAMPHLLYLGDPWLADWIEGSQLAVDAQLAEALPGAVQVEWERWVSDRWEPIVPIKDGTAGLSVDGLVKFEVRSPFEATDVGGVNGFWLRARLLSAPNRRLPRLVRLLRAMRLRISDSAVAEIAFLSTDIIPYQPIDLAKDILPFGKSPKPGTIFYVCSKLFKRQLTRFEISVSAVSEATSGNVEVEVQWEYLSKNGRWNPLEAEDNTRGLTISGIIGFDRPDDLTEFAILGETYWCVRARLDQGDYGGEEGSPPVLKLLSISFTERFQPWETAVAVNYGRHDGITTRLHSAEPLTPFVFEPDSQPMLMLAFDQKLTQTTHHLFQQIEERSIPVPGVVTWEYWNGKLWAALEVREDGTHGLTQTGVIEFLGPGEWQRSKEFEVTAYWLRVRWEPGDYVQPPRGYGIHLNVVDAVEGAEFKNEILGSSTGEKTQTFGLWNSPVLAAPDVDVREAGGASSDEENAWVRWHPVDNFYHSTAEERHFVIDLRLGTISFGDGIRGRIPPQGRDNVRASYVQGNGRRGNIPTGALTVLNQDSKGVQSVVNIEPAKGGADAETIDQAQLRGPWTLKHRYRAVTCEDFERLAMEASPDVARAWCFDSGGVIHVLVLPDDEGEETDRPLPNSRLIERVASYLDERRIVTTRIAVRGPDYVGVEFTFRIHLAPKQAGQFTVIADAIKRDITRFLHPLHGGADGTGWPIGRTIHVSELYYRVEQIAGVDRADSITIQRSGDSTPAGKIRLGSRSFPYARDIRVVQG